MKDIHDYVLSVQPTQTVLFLYHLFFHYFIYTLYITNKPALW